jgi:flagellar hook-basal body complex protein FliE
MIEAIAPVGLAAEQLLGVAPIQPQVTDRLSFSEILSKGIEATNSKLVEADRLVTQFAVDDSIPLHQVTYALEQARMSFELMIQVRNRALEATQQLMNMQI